MGSLAPHAVVKGETCKRPVSRSEAHSVRGASAPKPLPRIFLIPVGSRHRNLTLVRRSPRQVQILSGRRGEATTVLVLNRSPEPGQSDLAEGQRWPDFRRPVSARARLSDRIPTYTGSGASGLLCTRVSSVSLCSKRPDLGYHWGGRCGGDPKGISQVSVA